MKCLILTDAVNLNSSSFGKPWLISSFKNLLIPGERYDFIITADQPVGAYWIQLRGLGECGIRRAQQLAILRYARGPYQPTSPPPTYDVGVPQGVVSFKKNIYKNTKKNHLKFHKT